MIVDVVKYLFVGVKEDLDLFFARAQKKGILQFIGMEDKPPLPMPSHIQNMRLAIHVLKKMTVVAQVFPQGGAEYAKEVTARIIELKNLVEKLEEEERLIEAEISRIEILGDFSLQDIAYLQKEGNKFVQFFCMKTTANHDPSSEEGLFYVGTQFDLDYFMAVSDQHKSYPGMIELQITRSLPELKARLIAAHDEANVERHKLAEIARYIAFLEKSLIDELNLFHLQSAKTLVGFPFDQSVFIVEAWISKTKEPSLFALLEGIAVHCEPIAVESTDTVPTCMENTGVNKMGEDLVKIYDTPSTNDKDPSGWVIWFFLLFFSMIVADAGYGFLYLGLALFLKWKFPSMKQSAKRFLKMVLLLSTGCIVWGIMSCSFFGLYVSPNSFLSEISFVRYLAQKKAEFHFEHKDNVYQEFAKSDPAVAAAQTPKEFLNVKVKDKHPVLDTFNDNILLEISLMLGALHISCSLLRYVRRNFAGLGWVAFIIGGYLFFPSILKANSMIQYLGLVDKETAYAFGKQLVYGGTVGAVALSLIQNGWKGLAEILNVVSVFGDILSYLRIYALALAGSIMAHTFNDIGQTLGLAIGLVAVLAGHGVNLLLSIMGGVIHGLRLNFLEWYRYSFEGGGKLFDPLKRLKVD